MSPRATTPIPTAPPGGEATLPTWLPGVAAVGANGKPPASSYSPFIVGMRCLSTGELFPFGPVDVLPPGCQSYVEIVYDYPAITTALMRAMWESNRSGDCSIWRYGPLLPLSRPPRITLPVGWTPLLEVEGDYGVHLHLKDETRNPSGSFKDRASLMAVTAALAEGRQAIAVASTGNAASSLACLAANAGLRARAYVPENAPQPKLVQIQMHGAELVRVPGAYQEAFLACREQCQEPGWMNRSTGLNAVTREGKKTCSFEICEQLGWKVPDWVFVAVGNGNIISGMWKGFVELKAVGLTDSLPRMVAVQSRSCNAIAEAVRLHRRQRGSDAPSSERSIADSIQVAFPQDHVAAVRAVLESHGEAFEVDNHEIVAAIRTLAERWGMFAEPAAAASYAGFHRLGQAGKLAPGERVACVITGHGLKDTKAAGLIVENR
ncbi:MAG TPA: threonine synthase [Thermoanaerobaculia bacterium]|nr:threonine synthase [Thermoanaerobaculia bacterium]